MPRWFQAHGQIDSVDVLREIDKIIHTMDSSYSIPERYWNVASSDYFLPPQEDISKAISFGINLWKQCVLSFSTSWDSLLPIVSIFKAAMNMSYARQCLAILSIVKATPPTIFEIGAGAGFMAPMLLKDMDRKVTYIHHDVYQPYLILQAFFCQCLQHYSPAFHHVNESDNIQLQGLLDLSTYESRFNVTAASRIAMSAMGLSLNESPLFGVSKTVTLPWWNVDEFLASKAEISLWIANDCLQEMEHQQYQYWLQTFNKHMSTSDLLLISGSGAPHSFYLWDGLIDLSLSPMFMGRLSVPFKHGKRDIFELQLFANSDSLYFQSNDNPSAKTIDQRQARVVSRGLHGEVNINGTYPRMCYINPCAYNYVSILFPGLALEAPSDSGLYFDGVEVGAEFL